MDRRLWKKRWMRACLAAFFLRFVPYVRLVGLNGSMVTGAMQVDSDIDFYVVIEEGRIFTGRFLVTAVVHILGMRRHGQAIAGRICLNRYAASSMLVIRPANVYHARVFYNLIPLFAMNDAYDKYVKENRWMKDFGFPITIHQPVYSQPLFMYLFQKVAERIVDIIIPYSEPFLRRIQHQRLHADARAQLPGSRVIVSDKELCFHLAKKG